MNDAASLQNLNDIVVPAPAAWWPLAPGWYVLAAILLALLAWLAFRQWQRWRRNRYRRQALAELSAIRAGGDAGLLRQVPELLKRAALSAWPRDEVAGLSGAAWHRFLDDAAGMERFRGSAGEILDRLAYAGRGDGPPDPAEAVLLLDAAEAWLKQHRLPAGEG
jgi:uncharacterized protein YjiS (DUF1127 family)